MGTPNIDLIRAEVVNLSRGDELLEVLGSLDKPKNSIEDFQDDHTSIMSLAQYILDISDFLGRLDGVLGEISEDLKNKDLKLKELTENKIAVESKLEEGYRFHEDFSSALEVFLDKAGEILQDWEEKSSQSQELLDIIRGQSRTVSASLSTREAVKAGTFRPALKSKVSDADLTALYEEAGYKISASMLAELNKIEPITYDGVRKKLQRLGVWKGRASERRVDL